MDDTAKALSRALKSVALRTNYPELSAKVAHVCQRAVIANGLPKTLQDISAVHAAVPLPKGTPHADVIKTSTAVVMALAGAARMEPREDHKAVFMDGALTRIEALEATRPNFLGGAIAFNGLMSASLQGRASLREACKNHAELAAYTALRLLDNPDVFVENIVDLLARAKPAAGSLGEVGMSIHSLRLAERVLRLKEFPSYSTKKPAAAKKLLFGALVDFLPNSTAAAKRMLEDDPKASFDNRALMRRYATSFAAQREVGELIKLNKKLTTPVV